MGQTGKNPFEPPRSEIRSDRPVLDRNVFARARGRTWALIALLSLQLSMELLALVVSMRIGIRAALVALVIQVAPPAAAIVYLLRKSPNDIAFAMLCRALFGNLNGSATPPINHIEQPVTGRINATDAAELRGITANTLTSSALPGSPSHHSLADFF